MSDLRTERIAANLCTDCGKPAVYGSNSPDERLESRYCSRHVPAWLVSVYCRTMKRLPQLRPMRNG
jgi:hypothetical protein